MKCFAIFGIMIIRAGNAAPITDLYNSIMNSFETGQPDKFATYSKRFVLPFSDDELSKFFMFG